MDLFNKAVVSVIPLLPVSLVRKFANRYIAGETIGDAVRTVQDLMAENCCATLTILGEHITDRAKANQTVDEYIHLLDVIDKEHLDSNISVKPTQVGLQIDFEFCRENLSNIIQAAKARNNFVRLDMEDLPSKNPTLDIYRKLRQEYSNVGVVIQAYLRSSLRDIRGFLNNKNSFNSRLCKGIYMVPRKHAYKDPQLINENYLELLTELFHGKAYVGIATHDEKLVYGASRLIDRMSITKDSYEFQMLLGVDEELRNLIIQEGHKLRIYVPFGKDWYPYSIRRMRENPNIAGYVMKNMFTG